MPDSDKLVFISYRRSTSKHLARLIYDRLQDAGYDVFLDVNTIDSGTFDSMILNQISARPHFIVLVSPGALERCANEGDWLRREIEEAIRLRRNIVPIVEEGVSFSADSQHLPEAIRDEFRRYNSLPLVHFYFDAVMDTLVSRFLKQPVQQIEVNPPPTAEEEPIRELIQKPKAEQPTEAALDADGYTARGYKKYIKQDFEGAIADFSEAIRLDPELVSAYNNRALAYYTKGDQPHAIEDWSKVLELEPRNSQAMFMRGSARHDAGDFAGAISDFDEVLRLSPGYDTAYLSRAMTYETGLKDLPRAIADYQQYVALGGSRRKEIEAKIAQLKQGL